MVVEFSVLKRQYDLYQEEYEEEVLKVLRTGWYIMGSKLAKFEKEFASYMNIKHCIGVGNGLDALRIALMSLGIESGDEVIVQANTFIATALAISEVGARPVFADVDCYGGLDFEKVEKHITNKTKAIIAVHMYGQPCDMENIVQIARKHKLFVIEDCAQAHGAVINNRKVGTFGDIACFSFYPMKPLGCFGDGGAIITDKNEYAQNSVKIRNYGSRIKYNHEIKGINSRLDELQAAILSVNLKYLDKNNKEREKIAKAYYDGIKNPKVYVPKVREFTKHAHHVFPVYCSQRDLLREYLEERGIKTQIHYPIPCHLAECYGELGYTEGSFPRAELYAKQEISLPIFVGMRDEEIEYVIRAINNF